MNAKKTGLGRGLTALLGDAESVASAYPVTAIPLVPVDIIIANPMQPRSKFEKLSLEELAQSIKNFGIIQPVTVRKVENGKYQLIAGERRLMAAKMAGLEEIPAFVRDAADSELLELALVENIQRENLNSIEVALSFRRLIEECNITQEHLSEKIGKKRTTITNYLRLLKLPPEIQAGVRDNIISMGHARSLINIPDIKQQLNLFARITEKELSVRQTEELVRLLNMKNSEKPVTRKIAVSREISAWKKTFSDKTKAKVSVKISGTGKGTISIQFNNPDHLSEILKFIR